MALATNSPACCVALLVRDVEAGEEAEEAMEVSISEDPAEAEAQETAQAVGVSLAAVRKHFLLEVPTGTATEEVMQPSQTNDQCFTTQGGLSVTVNTGSWDAKSQNSAPNSCRFPQMRVAQLQWEKMLPVRVQMFRQATVKVPMPEANTSG